MLRQLATIFSEEFRYRSGLLWYGAFSSPKSLPKVLVNGSPKTGTVWMLKMVTSLPGYHRAPGENFRGDLRRYHKLQPGDAVHGHDEFTPELWNILNHNSIKVILMIRDPRDQAVSRMFHARRDRTHQQHRELNRLDIDQALMASIEGRSGLRGVVAATKLTSSWLCERNKSLFVKYEDLVSDPVRHFQRVLNYLRLPINSFLTQSIIERNRFERLSIGRKIWHKARTPGQEDKSSHFRKGIVGDWKNHFNELHIQRFKQLAGDILIEWAYEQDHDW